jgi:hypothetical protein
MFSAPVSSMATTTVMALLFPTAVVVAGLAADPASALVYQQFKSNSCPHSLCTLDFASAPAGKQLQITSESCEYGTTTQASKIVAAEFDVVNNSDNSQIGLQEFVVPVLKSSLSTLGNTYAANNTTFFIVPVGALHIRARVSVSVNNGASISCRISGNIVTP